MCVTFCHRKNVLYWNHDDCAVHCPLADGPQGACETCRHHLQQGICWLTNAPLPESGGCCHHDVVPVQGWQVVTCEMLAPLGVANGEKATDVLARWDAPHRRLDHQGRVALVDPDELGIPEVAYGIGTEAIREEPFPWPEEVWPNEKA